MKPLSGDFPHQFRGKKRTEALLKVIREELEELKNAMDNEYRRRGKEIPAAFGVTPVPGEPVLLEIAQKVLTDVYEYDKSPEHDWRETFGPWDIAAAPKWDPVIAHIKTLMTSVAGVSKEKKHES